MTNDKVDADRKKLVKTMLGMIYPNQKIMSLAAKAGIVFPGHRLSKVPPGDILEALAEEYLHSQEAREAVSVELNRNCREQIEMAVRLSPDAMKRAIKTAVEKGGPEPTGKLLWALWSQNGDRNVQLIAYLLKSMRRAVRAERRTLAERTQMDRIIKGTDKMLYDYQDLGKKYESTLGAYKQAKEDLSESLREKKRLSTENIRLAEELANFRAQQSSRPQEALVVNLNPVMRALEKIQYRIDHPVEGTGKNVVGNVSEYVKSLGSMLSEIKIQNEAERKQMAGRIEDLRTILCRLELSVKGLRKGQEAKASTPARISGDHTAIFVDSQNLYYAAREMGGKIDYEQLLTQALRNRRLIKAVAYVVRDPGADQSKYFAMLRNKGYELRIKELIIRSDGSAKANWDMEMALDILSIAARMDVIVLVTGDGDFASLVNQIKTIGPRVEVMGFPSNTAVALREAADLYTPLNESVVMRPQAEPDRPAVTMPGDNIVVSNRTSETAVIKEHQPDEGKQP